MSGKTTQELTVNQQVEQINTMLRSFGREAVQEMKVGGMVRYGYKPQYVFDAVNAIFSQEKWRYEVVSRDVHGNQVVAEVKLFLLIAGDWICKGSHAGQMQIIRDNVGDAMKGAITDALQKAFSLLSIGSDAYRGLLKSVYLGKGSSSGNSTSTNRNNQNGSSGQSNGNNGHSNGHSNGNGLPKIAGIKYQQRDGIVIAHGNSFDKKELLKSAGFRWSQDEKNWYKELTH